MKITKWKVMQKDSSIGLLLLIVSFFAFLLIVLGPTTIGVKYTFPGHYAISNSASSWVPDTVHRITLGQTNGYEGATWTHTGEALAVIGMVFAGISWLAICAGWYFDPTKLDERTTLLVSAVALVIGMTFAIAGPAYESAQYPHSNKGYLAGMEILAIVPSVLTMLLMVDPLIMVFNKNYASKAEAQYQKAEKDLEQKVSKEN